MWRLRDLFSSVLKMDNYLVIIDTAYGLMPVLVCADSLNEVSEILKNRKMITSESDYEVRVIDRSNKKGIIKSWMPTGG